MDRIQQQPRKRMWSSRRCMLSGRQYIQKRSFVLRDTYSLISCSLLPISSFSHLIASSYLQSYSLHHPSLHQFRHQYSILNEPPMAPWLNTFCTLSSPLIFLISETHFANRGASSRMRRRSIGTRRCRQPRPQAATTSV